MRAHTITLKLPSNPSKHHFADSSLPAKPEKTVDHAENRQIDMEGDGDLCALLSEGDVLPADFLTFDTVQERLVEAMITCWRSPDRERSWQRIRSHWPEMLLERNKGDYDARGGAETSSSVPLRPAASTRAEIAEMEEAFGWVSVLGGDERRLVGLAIEQLARGAREVSWSRLLRPMGLTRGTDGLRKRYARAINAVCLAQNGGNPQASVSSGTN